MKLRLPVSFYRVLVLLAGVCTTQAAVRHTDVSLNTYVDFATNSGRYATGTTNALLDYIRTQEGGVTIQYTGGQESYVLPNGMISFDSVSDDGNMTVVGYNYVVTVAHNSSQMSPTFSGHDYGIGASKAIKYLSAEEYGEKKNFVNDIADYKLSRLTKLVTDAPVAQMAGGSGTDYKGQLVYRTAGGYQKVRDAEGKITDETEKLTYQVGGVGSITNWSQSSDPSVRTADISGASSWDSQGVGEGTPLPFGGQQGDSGSPYFVWDSATGDFKLLMVHSASYDTSGKPEKTVGYEATDWARNVMESDTVRVDMSRVTGNLYINGVQKADDKDGVADVVNGMEYTVQPAKGYLSDANGNLYDKNWNSVAFNGIETGQHTWKSLSELKNTDAWYAYGNEYLNATESIIVQDKEKVAAEGVTYSRLFMTQNLVFEAAADNPAYTINVTEDTDLGAGYLQFAANGKKDVSFNLVSDKTNLLDSAGYVVDAGVQVNVSLRNWDSTYMREWRKVGEGTLNICGKDGNNEIFLNVGGTGKTLLNQSGGYAAYNVLVNMGSTVVIKDTSQIYRDLTFGNGGGVLDMNGNSMDWYTTNGQDRKDAFTINALTEEAVIANSAARHAELIYKESGDTRFAGSFQDSKDSSLGITYSVDGGTWELNSIRTSLSHKDSGLTVEKGAVKLAGTLTVHGYGTTHTADSADFSTRENDWHYADATMNVTVKDGAVFELESHARLTGTVTVESGGKYIVHEGVQNAMEYIEGGEELESTAAISAYYGHKGDVKLAKDATLSWQRGSKEVATLKGTSAGGSMSKVESTISSETQLKLAGAGTEPGVITDAALTLHSGTTLQLENIMLSATASIATAGAATVDMQGASLYIYAENAITFTSVMSENLFVSSCGVDWGMTLNAGLSVLDVQSSALNGALTISGTSFMVDFTALDMKDADVIFLSFGDEVKFADLEKMQVSAVTQSGEMLGYYVGGDAGGVYFTMIPEPATATLSLLALAALAARRRRSA